MHHILVCLDGSNLAKKVMPYALAIARSFNSRITLLHVLEQQLVDPCKPVDPFAWEMQKHEAMSALKEIEESADTLSVTSEVVEGKPAERINEWLNKNHVDLTVLCSHGEGGHSQWALASTTQKLIAGSMGAILLVPASVLAQKQPNEIHFKRLLVPLDGSSWSESALPFAINIANNQNSELVLAHVLPEPGLTHIGPPDAEVIHLEDQIEGYNKRVASQYLDQTKSWLLSSIKLPVNTLLINRHGVSDELNYLIDTGSIDLVVMSLNGNAGYNEKCCGKVALEFLTNTQVPVMFLRGRALNADIHSDLNGMLFDLAGGLLESNPRLPTRAAP